MAGIFARGNNGLPARPKINRSNLIDLLTAFSEIAIYATLGF